MATAEAQPLLGPALQDPEEGSKHTDVILDFNPDGDIDNPREWTPAFKWLIVSLIASVAFTVTFTCISVVPLAGMIVDDLDNGSASSSSSALLVTIWEFGEAAGPLLIAPLSEVYGRYPVFNACNVLFVAATVLASLSRSSATFIGARALTGLAVASNTLGPAIIGDMFISEQRGTAMSFSVLAPLIGGAIGPAISGAIAQTLGWRGVLLVAAGLAATCAVLFLVCFKETYKMAILRRRVANMTGSEETVVPHGRHGDGSLRELWHAISRPAAVLADSGVLIALSIFGSVCFSYYYVLTVTLPGILQDVYDFSPAMIGVSFLSFSIGSFISIIICNLGLDRIYIKLRGPDATKGKPEHRLPFTILGAFLLPVSVLGYGLVAQYHAPVSLLLLSTALLGFTLLFTLISLMAYVVDAFGLYSASALTGVIVTRCLMGTFLPLVAAPLIERFGYGLAFTCFAGISLVLAPIPIVVFVYGESWRQRSKYTMDAVH
ncbi:MFS general substrate transporter [Lophiostoma macrostomum CBS 122681]|uniref:MFS general substrate transporter n=1 Tax=Lophiostoma macrostomum CBS 122681 TaxID=1314788 RepID=A0A6A6SL60_9PLEO|nr:MFS general substrate transporter [Lophiostoma macrostomum CBS 122681]